VDWITNKKDCKKERELGWLTIKLNNNIEH